MTGRTAGRRAESLAEFVPTIEAGRFADLQRRLRASPAPWLPRLEGWEAGPPAAVVEDMVEAWITFDPTVLEAELARSTHFCCGSGMQQVHVLHRRSPRADATPLLLVHGWPSSFLEFTAVVDLLADPAAHGRGSEQAFHVVVPSLPGYLYSGRPEAVADYRPSVVADRLDAVMGSLGYDQYLASGTDIGARIVSWLAVRHPGHVLGAHLTTNALSTAPAVGRGSREQHSGGSTDWYRTMAAWEEAEGGYHHLLRTSPVASAWAFNDSPAAMAAWVLEKWHAWGDHLDISSPRIREHLLGLLTLYWTTRSFPSTFFHYYASQRAPGARPNRRPQVPVSIYASRADIGGVPPGEVIDEQFGDVRRTVLESGGHFMAFEQPALFVADLQGFSRTVPVV